MYVAMPFPYCHRCHKKWDSKAEHDGCGGLLELDPDTKIIRCTKCNKTWTIWQSVFHCPKNHSFEAYEVEDAVNNLIEECKLIAEELALMQAAYWKRKEMANDSSKQFIRDSLESIGYTASKMAGYLFEKLVDYIFDLFGRILKR